MPVANKSRLRLLPREALIRTGPVDHADWNYRPLIGIIQRLRFRLVKRLLEGLRFECLLEIGYGSGVFMPELARLTDRLFGIDPHPLHREVQAVLREHGIAATLMTGTAERMPFEEASFDCAVSVSAMEYVEDIPAACQELTRVIRPGGVIVIATPGASPIWDSMLRLSTGESPAQYADRRQRMLPALKRSFEVSEEIKVPGLGGRLFRLYTGVRLVVPGDGKAWQA